MIMEDQSKYYPERFVNQAKTIMDFGARLDRICDRHSPWYPSEDHQTHAVCNYCGGFWPCADRKDAEWRS
jgi:hypothetical protein